MAGQRAEPEAVKNSIPRLRSIRYKDGRAFTVLHPKREDVVKRLRQSVEVAMDDNPDGVVAYALVVWNLEGSVFPAFYIGDRSSICSGQIPQLAKDALLAELAARWAKD